MKKQLGGELSSEVEVMLSQEGLNAAMSLAFGMLANEGFDPEEVLAEMFE